MKTSEAQTIIRGMVRDGKLQYEPSKGLLLTPKCEGITLESLAELSVEQVSKIGQEFDPLFDTRKRVSSLLKSGVSALTLRNLLEEIEGTAPETTQTNGTETEELTPALPGTEPEGINTDENIHGQPVLQGAETDTGTDRTNGTEGHTAAETQTMGRENGTDDSIREGVNGGTNRRPSRGSSRNSGSAGTGMTEAANVTVP